MNNAKEKRQHWDQCYRSVDIGAAQPARVLLECSHLLPARGRALDLACGAGANACYMARQGLDVYAWDISPQVITKLQEHSDLLKLGIHAQVRDVESYPPEHESFDVIVVSRFLYRPLFPALERALKPGGLLFYQTFCGQPVVVNGQTVGPGNPNYRLRPKELLAAFRDLRVLFYREDGARGDQQCGGLPDQAMIVVAKD